MTTTVNVPAVNTDAVLTFAATVGLAWVLNNLVWSYTAQVIDSLGGPLTKLPGRLTVKDGTTTIFDLDLPAGVSSTLQFPQFSSLKGTQGNSMEVRLYAAGVGVQGKLNTPGIYQA